MWGQRPMREMRPASEGGPYSGKKSSVAGGGAGGDRGGVVAVASTGDELAATVRGNDFDLDSTEGAVTLAVARIVGEGVLVADIVGDLLADVVDVVDIFREIGKAAGGQRDFLESFLGALGVFLALLTEQADGVDDGICFLDFADGFFERIAAGVVFTVGDYQENVLVLGTFFQVVDRADDGVIESGAAARIDAFEGFLEFGDAVGEILVEVEIKIVVEVDDEGLVLWIAVFDEGDGGFVHAGTFVAHAAAVVNDQA